MGEAEVGPVTCAACGRDLNEVDRGARCPACGSTKRNTQVGLPVTSTVQVSVDALLSRPWDGLTLTLAGVIYGIVVTVGGVLVAAHGTLPTAMFAVAALALLVLGLLFPQPVIGTMRRLVRRADPR